MSLVVSVFVAASARSLSELHAEMVREHPGTLVSVCRHRPDEPWLERAIRTPTGQRVWQRDDAPRTGPLDPFWGYGSLYYGSILADPRWATEPEGPAVITPVSGELEALPPIEDEPEFGCIHTALPGTPRWVRMVTAEGRLEVLGRPPAFPVPHGLGPPLRTKVLPKMFEVWVTPVAPEVFRRLPYVLGHRFQGPDYPFSHHPFIADWDDAERIWHILGAPATRAIGRATWGEHPVYLWRADDPDALWAAISARGEGVLRCSFGRGSGMFRPCKDWHLERFGDWIAVSGDEGALADLIDGDASWWEDPDDKAVYQRDAPVSQLSLQPIGAVRITAEDGWWMVRAH